MIDDKEQYQNKNNIPSVSVSKDEDMYEGEYWFNEDEYEYFDNNKIIDFGE